MPIEEVYLFQVSTDADGNQRRERIENNGELILAHGVNEVGIGCHATMRGSLEPISDMKVCSTLICGIHSFVRTYVYVSSNFQELTIRNCKLSVT